MNKAFSLLEIIIVIVIIAIITSFAIPKFTNINSKTSITKLKSQLAIIRNELASKRSENVLLSNEKIIESLDEAEFNKEKELLFTSLVDFSIVSTTNSIKEVGKWAKTSDTKYEFFIQKDSSVKFFLENEYLICKSSHEVCKDYE